jgi:hypothetical protein
MRGVESPRSLLSGTGSSGRTSPTPRWLVFHVSGTNHGREPLRFNRRPQRAAVAPR